MPGGADVTHQLEAGVRYQWRTGIGYQRDRGALRQPLEDLGTGLRGIVLMIERELRADRLTLGQPARNPGVLAGDDVDARQSLQRTQGDVGEIADRGRHQMEPGRGLWCRQLLAGDRKGPGRSACRGIGMVEGTGFCAHNANLEGWQRLRHIRKPR